LHFLELTGYLLPVRSLPKELPATTAFAKTVQPGEGPRWHAIAELLLGYRSEFSSARHATRFAQRQVKAAEDEQELLLLAESMRDEESADFAVADDADAENSRVGCQ
jgi:hypothetical protein